MTFDHRYSTNATEIDVPHTNHVKSTGIIENRSVWLLIETFRKDSNILEDDFVLYIKGATVKRRH